MTTSAADYIRLTRSYALGLNFCLTLIRDRTPDQVIDRLGGAPTVDITGAAALPEAADLVPHRPDVMGDGGAFHADRITGLDFIAATRTGDWTVVVEPNGFRCNDEGSPSRSTRAAGRAGGTAPTRTGSPASSRNSAST